MDPNLHQLTANIVSAYLGNNNVRVDEVPAFIGHVFAALSGTVNPPPAEPEKLVPRVPIKKTITDEFLISLEDGKKYKSLKRHLAGAGLTPQEYRAKWGLPNDYPMVAPAYAKQRSELAKALGLGQRNKAPEPAPEPVKKASKAKKKEAAPEPAPEKEPEADLVG